MDRQLLLRLLWLLWLLAGGRGARDDVGLGPHDGLDPGSGAVLFLCGMVRCV